MEPFRFIHSFIKKNTTLSLLYVQQPYKGHTHVGCRWNERRNWQCRTNSRRDGHSGTFACTGNQLMALTMCKMMLPRWRRRIDPLASTVQCDTRPDILYERRANGNNDWLMTGHSINILMVDKGFKWHSPACMYGDMSPLLLEYLQRIEFSL